MGKQMNHIHSLLKNKAAASEPRTAGSQHFQNKTQKSELIYRRRWMPKLKTHSNTKVELWLVDTLLHEMISPPLARVSFVSCWVWQPLMRPHMVQGWHHKRLPRCRNTTKKHCHRHPAGHSWEDGYCAAQRSGASEETTYGLREAPQLCQKEREKQKPESPELEFEDARTRTHIAQVSFIVAFGSRPLRATHVTPPFDHSLRRHQWTSQ